MRRVTLLPELAEVHSGNLNIRLWSLSSCRGRTASLQGAPHRKTNVKKTDDKKQKCKKLRRKRYAQEGQQGRPLSRGAAAPASSDDVALRDGLTSPPMGSDQFTSQHSRGTSVTHPAPYARFRCRHHRRRSGNRPCRGDAVCPLWACGCCIADLGEDRLSRAAEVLSAVSPGGASNVHGRGQPMSVAVRRILSGWK